jgi:hypothetical protein
MPHKLAVAESRCKRVENDGWFARGNHSGREAADGEDFEEFGDVVAICLVFGRFQGFENFRRILLFETRLSNKTLGPVSNSQSK